jgi:two-component system chemotaxis response regulator CheY
MAMKQILLVDDSPTILMSMERILSHAGYCVQKASSAEGALALLTKGERPNLIITDFNMGAMNGIDLVKAVRKLPPVRFIPILLLTTESAQNRRDEAKAAGATGWLVKPVQPDALVAVVKQIVPGA